MGVIADQLRASLRSMAEADARLYRGLAGITADATPPALEPALDERIAAAIALLEQHGYTVTR